MGDASQLDITSVRTLLRDNDETYDADWRVVREAMQNALDSFARPIAVLPYFEIRPGGDCKVKVTLDCDNNSVTVEDNGWGIPQDKYMSLFHLGASEKRESASNPYFKGSQGVGIKAVVFGSDNFRIESNDGADSWHAEVTDWHDYANMPTPWTVTRQAGPLANRGTKVSYSLHRAEDSVQIYIDECVAKFIESHNAEYDAGTGEYQHTPTATSFDDWKLVDAVKHHLLHHTYAGCLYRTILPGKPAVLPLPDITFDLTIIPPGGGLAIDGFDCTGGALSENDIPAVYSEPTFPVGNQPMQGDWKALVENQILRLNKGFFQVLDKDGCRELLGSFTDNPAAGTKTFDAPTGVVLAEHANALNRINGIYLCMGNANILSQIGRERKIVLSANGLIVPDAPLHDKVKGELPRLQNCHIILDVDDTLGFGKNKPGRRMGNYYDYIRAIWTNLRRVLNLLVEPDGGGNVVGFNAGQKTMQTGLKLKVLQDYFGRSSIPTLEQDVVQAFSVFSHKMSVGNDWASMVSVHTKTTIDAIMVNPISNASGGGILQDQDTMQVEFKYRLKGVSKGDDEGDQTFGQYDFAVYWKHDDDWAGFLAWAAGHKDWDGEINSVKNNMRGVWGTWTYASPLPGGENYPLFARYRVKTSGGWGLGNTLHVYLVPLEMIFNDLCKHHAVRYLVAEGVHNQVNADALARTDAIDEADAQFVVSGNAFF